MCVCVGREGGGGRRCFKGRGGEGVQGREGRGSGGEGGGSKEGVSKGFQGDLRKVKKGLKECLKGFKGVFKGELKVGFNGGFKSL